MPNRPLKIVAVEPLVGGRPVQAFYSTRFQQSGEQVLIEYSGRWSIEVTFQETKGKLGLEEPQNRTELAVQRTAPIALCLYSLVVLWYLQTGRKLRAARPSVTPWYCSKTQPAFSDMLATLRRASWAERLFDSHGNDSTFRKRLEPLLACLDAAA